MTRRAPRRRLFAGLAAAALLWGVCGSSLPTFASDSPGIPSAAGECVFSQLNSPQLAATYTPGLMTISGVGTCVTNSGRGTVTLNLGAAFGAACLGGAAPMSGSAIFDGGIANDQLSLFANSVSADSIHLVIQNPDDSFVAEADLAFGSGTVLCATDKSFSTNLTGTMDFEESF